jgi:uncharacterized membrane protein YidH (DUF202 family)
LTSGKEYDEGLAGDRTTLAWTRTALNVAVNGVLLVHAALEDDLPALGVAIAVSIALWTGFAQRRGRRTYLERRVPAPGSHHQQAALELHATLTVLTAAASAMLVALHA